MTLNCGEYRRLLTNYIGKKDYKFSANYYCVLILSSAASRRTASRSGGLPELVNYTIVVSEDL